MEIVTRLEQLEVGPGEEQPRCAGAGSERYRPGLLGLGAMTRSRYAGWVGPGEEKIRPGQHAGIIPARDEQNAGMERSGMEDLAQPGPARDKERPSRVRDPA